MLYQERLQYVIERGFNMSLSKAWDWNIGKNDEWWFSPCEESFYLLSRWKNCGYKSILDFGCGMGRHSIYFAKNGFNVFAFDLSKEGTDHLSDWAKRENLDIDIKIADMLDLPYPDNMFDCLFAMHVMYHTDTPGMMKIMNEIKRVVKSGGEIFVTLGSKNSDAFSNQKYPKVDENTIIKTEDGPEKNVPHYYLDLDDIITLFGKNGFELIKIRHIDDCYHNNTVMSSWHYFVLARKI
jgi:SAM-dependent methyltransferase